MGLNIYYPGKIQFKLISISYSGRSISTACSSMLNSKTDPIRVISNTFLY